MNKKLTAVIIAMALLFFITVIIAGCRSRAKPGQIAVQNSEPQYTLHIEDAGKPATNATDALPVLTTSAADTAAVTETTAAPERTKQSETTKKPKKTKPTTTVTTEADYSIEPETLTETEPLTVDVRIDKDGVYTTKDDVALYIYTYGELPSNFITKKEAQKLGWEGGSLEPYAPGCCIGGSYFGNYEGQLPEKKGREYTECDIDTLGKKSRGAKRIVFSNDGLIYYTGDHYKTFELLYGEE